MKIRSLFKWINDLLERYRSTIYAVLAVLVGVLLILAEVYPGISTYVYSPTLLAYVTLLIVMDIARVLGSRRFDEALTIGSNQDDTFNDLLDAVSGCKQADLLEYAGATTLPLIRKLRKANVKLRLLVKHPDTVQGLQRQRTIATLDTLYNAILTDYDGNFEIRCYTLPYSLRGRHLVGRFLELGWLTPDTRGQTTFGQSNPSILVEMPDSRRESLRSFFERTFNDYWDHTETEAGHKVLERLKSAT